MESASKKKNIMFLVFPSPVEMFLLLTVIGAT